MKIIMDKAFIEDLTFWIRTDRKTAGRLMRLIEAIRRDPRQGIGKPEPLKHFGGETWSRRLTPNHRVVYRIRDDRIELLQARHHYS